MPKLESKESTICTKIAKSQNLYGIFHVCSLQIHQSYFDDCHGYNRIFGIFRDRDITWCVPSNIVEITLNLVRFTKILQEQVKDNVQILTFNNFHKDRHLVLILPFLNHSSWNVFLRFVITWGSRWTILTTVAHLLRAKSTSTNATKSQTFHTLEVIVPVYLFLCVDLLKLSPKVDQTARTTNQISLPLVLYQSIR